MDVLDFDFLRLLLELFVDEFLLGEEGLHVRYCYLFDLELLFEFGEVLGEFGVLEFQGLELAGIGEERGV